MNEMWVRSLGQKDPLEEGIAATPVFLPGKSHGQRRLAGYSLWDHKSLVTKQQMHTHVDTHTHTHTHTDIYILTIILGTYYHYTVENIEAQEI